MAHKSGTPRFCACGCGERLPDDMRPDAKYLNPSHRAKGAKKRKRNSMLRKILYGLVREGLIRTLKDVKAVRTVLKQAGLPRMSDKTMKNLIAKLRTPKG